MRLGASAASIALGATILGSASAGASSPLEIDVRGGDGPVFEVEQMHPGFETSSIIDVTNTTDEAGTVGLRITDIVSDDNGCSAPEARVDPTCGPGDGELGAQVLLTVERGSGEGFEPVAANVLLADLSDGVLLEERLAGGATSSVRLTLTLPVESGNETQTDAVDFTVQIFGRAETALTNTVVLGERRDREAAAGSRGAEHVIGLDARAATGTRLPSTGSDPALLLTGGAGAAALGVMLSLLGRRRATTRRATR